MSGAPIGKKEENAAIKLLGVDTTAIVTMGEYVKSLVAICNTEARECAIITVKNKPIKKLIMDHIKDEKIPDTFTTASFGVRG